MSRLDKLSDFMNEANKVQDNTKQPIQNLESEMNVDSDSSLKIAHNKSLQNCKQGDTVTISKRFRQPHSAVGQSSESVKLERLKINRKLIKSSIKKVNAEIREMSDFDPRSKFHKYLQISEDPEAYDNAARLIHKMEEQKKQLIEKKHREEIAHQKKVERARNEVELMIASQISESRENRRQAIAKRIQQQRRRHQELKVMDQLSNSLIREIQNAAQGRNIISQAKNYGTLDVSYGKNRPIASRKPQKQARSKSPVNQSPRRYPKGRFAFLIQEQEKQRLQSVKAVYQRKHSQLERRRKYGELVSNQLHKTIDTNNQGNTTGTATPNKNSVQTFQHKKKSTHKSYECRRAVTESVDGGAGLTKIQIQRLERQKEMRNRTNQRLKQLQMIDEDLNKVEKPFTNRYKNYLKYQPRAKDFEQDQTKKILESSNMSKEQKYIEVMNRAHLLEHKANIKQQIKAGHQQIVGCIVASINAKLALLDTL